MNYTPDTSLLSQTETVFLILGAIGCILFVLAVVFLIKIWQAQTAIMKIQDAIIEINERQRAAGAKTPETSSPK